MNGQTSTQSRSRAPWPRGILGPPPGLKEINLLCWGIFFLCIVAPACFFLVVQIKTGKYFYEGSGVDFVYLYGVGEIANSHPATAVYDARLQLATFNDIVPLNHGTYGPSPYPPFVPEFFRLLALLPFPRAFLLWVSVTLVLYLAGTLLLLREFFPNEPLKQSLMLCLALTYFPFLRNTLINGQLSAAAFFALAIAICLERRGYPFLSGIALSILSYKPPLLIFILPMLLLTRRFRAFGGWVAGAMGLAAITTALAGVEIWPAYLRFMHSFGQTSGLYGSTTMQIQKYVDLSAQTYGIPGGRSRIVLGLLLCLGAASALWFFSLVLRVKPAGKKAVSSLGWSAAIAWTMVVNLYCPIYDSILIVIAFIAAISSLQTLKWSAATYRVGLLALVTLAISWISEAGAKQFGVQLLTFAILAFAISTTALLQKANKSTLAPG